MTARLVLLALLLTCQSCLGLPDQRMVNVEHPIVTTENGVVYQDQLAGTGELTPEPGMKVTIDYVCKLEDATEIDSTYARGKAATFVMGEAWLPGLNEGVTGMRVGGRRKVTLPPDLAYGEAGVEGLVPPNSKLFFELELVALE